jgi:tetratricopeptide (TPR) repeat protein
MRSEVMTQELARRLMLQGHRAASTLPAAIFGTVGDLQSILELNKPRLRLGVWPFTSTDRPNSAMGLATVLALLLERYRDLRVYRLFARVEGEPQTYIWSINQSQFDVDDWQIDDLDENLALWGSLTSTEGSLHLEITVENDFLEDNDNLKTFTYTGKSLIELTNQLIKASEDIAAFIDAQDFKLIAPIYTSDDWNATSVQMLIEQAFDWERRLFLSIWGQDWGTMEADKTALIKAGQGMGEFGAWVVARSIARGMVMSDKVVTDVLVSFVDDVLTAFPDSLFPAIYLGGALYETGHVQDAYTLMEAAIQEHEDDAALYLALGELYRAGGRPGDALSLYQEAVQSDVVTPDIYLRYADLVLAMDFNNFVIEDYVLIDPDEVTDERMIYEAIEAYQAVLDQNPDHVEALQRQLLQFLELGESDQRFWTGFEHMVALDETGERVRVLLDVFYNLDDVTPAFKILKDTASAYPNRYDLAMNIAVAYLADEQGDAAITHLERARKLTDDAFVHADIDRLMLAAEDPDFEMRLGELTDIISAGNALSADDVEFLEDALEKAPSFAEGYVLLGNAYRAWDELGTAVETLLDGHQQLPDDPDIALLLAQTLWESGEQASAFGYLNKSLEKNPAHVPLLAMTGRYLYEDDQEEAAKAYLARAELIAPNHPVLNDVRVFIARTLD